MDTLVKPLDLESKPINCSLFTPDCGFSEDEQFSLCCLCGESFPSIRSLHRHVNVIHEEVADAFDFPEIFSETKSDPSPPPASPLELSDECSSKSELSSCSKKSGQCRGTPSTFTCSYKSNQCDICMKTFSTISYLKQHISTVHEGVKPYSCAICQKRYTQKHSLKTHMASSHSSFSGSSHDQSTASPSSNSESHVSKHRRPAVRSYFPKKSSVPVANLEDVSAS